MPELEAGLEHIRHSPKVAGAVEMIVRRPRVDEREILARARLDLVEGLVGDHWSAKGNRQTAAGAADLEAQITIMNSRAIALVAQNKERWPLAGDQFYIDLDLSVENLPPGTRLAVGSAVVEITAKPHTGCRKFKNRFGAEAMRFVNWGSELRLRGANAKVVQAGDVRVGDLARKLGQNC
jgi:hypothetical protein